MNSFPVAPWSELDFTATYGVGFFFRIHFEYSVWILEENVPVPVE